MVWNWAEMVYYEVLLVVLAPRPVLSVSSPWDGGKDEKGAWKRYLDATGLPAPDHGIFPLYEYTNVIQSVAPARLFTSLHCRPPCHGLRK